MPEPVIKERAEIAALKFHQLSLAAHWERQEGGHTNITVNHRDAKVVREFLADCCASLPTMKQLEAVHQRLQEEGSS